MQRIIIRNNRSLKPVKPRVFDVLIDNEEIFLEVKNTKNSEIIALSDVMEQIDKARGSYYKR